MVSIVAQERAPGLIRCASLSSPAIPTNRSIADHDAELEKLASDPLSAPHPVVARHARDQVPHLGTEMRTSATGAGLPTPEQAPALTMPAHDRFGCDEGQMLAPAGAESRAKILSRLSRGATPGLAGVPPRWR